MRILIVVSFACLLAIHQARAGECPPGVPIVSCARNPCNRAKCLWYPDAVCKPNFCGQCSARFYDVESGVDVTERCDCPFGCS